MEVMSYLGCRDSPIARLYLVNCSTSTSSSTMDDDDAEYMQDDEVLTNFDPRFI